MMCEIDWRAVAAFAQVFVSIVGYLLAFVGVIIAIVGTHWLTRRREERARKHRVDGHLGALAAQVNAGGRMAAGYLKDVIPAPSYRLPLSAFETSLPALLGDGELSRDEVETFYGFQVNADSINRGLDQVEQFISSGRFDLAQDETRRLRVKCENGMPTATAGPWYYVAAAAILAKHITDFTPLEIKVDDIEEKAAERIRRLTQR